MLIKLHIIQIPTQVTKPIIKIKGVNMVNISILITINYLFKQSLLNFI
jgi:hypothetical protein